MVKFPLAAGGHFTLMLSLGVIPCEYPDNLYLFINYQTLKTARSYLQCLDKTPECDRRTDGQICCGYYSAMHCGCAV